MERVRKKAAVRLTVCARVAGKTWGLDLSLRQRLYKTVFFPTFLYAASVWAPALLKTGTRRKALISAQRLALIWYTTAFRSTSGDALSLLADVLPLDLEAKLRADKYFARKKKRCSLFRAVAFNRVD